MYLWDSDPDLMPYEGTHHFIEAATFADDIKYHGHGWQADYHFLDIAYIAEGKESDYNLPNTTKNLTSAIPNLVAMISGKDGEEYKQSEIYQSIKSYYPDDDKLANSFALRLLIHYLGDIHQPFHCEARFNKENISGDKGANTFPLKYHYNVDELHALLDMIVYEGYPNEHRPMTDDSYATFKTKTQELMDRNTDSIPSGPYSIGNEISWAKDSYQIAKTLYDGLEENGEVPQSYIDKNRPIAESQIMKGGHRLAYVLDYIFQDTSKDEFIANEIANILVALLQ